MAEVRQGADVMQQAGKQGLLRVELPGQTGQHEGDCRDLGAVFPQLLHALSQQRGTAAEQLTHGEGHHQLTGG